ncbi:UNVERIFIED_CONTAM: hypothetical protein Sradi_0513700 [Sesamum radiatum]|uniref:Uncharacterized protein n=1 Tax=Sesamum radiatum TaxID=300843 RepID=A0AAW2VHD7_SESRA
MEELMKGVNTNLADYDKRTALHLASCEGCTEIVVLLLERGADVNSMDRWGRTVSKHATFVGVRSQRDSCLCHIFALLFYSCAMCSEVVSA